MALSPITSISKLRSQLKEYIDGLPSSGTVVVLKHSEPVAALIPYSEYEQYVQYLEERADAALGAALAQEFRKNPDDFLNVE